MRARLKQGEGKRERHVFLLRIHVIHCNIYTYSNYIYTNVTIHVYTKHAYTCIYVYMYVHALYMSTCGQGYWDIGIRGYGGMDKCFPAKVISGKEGENYLYCLCCWPLLVYIQVVLVVEWRKTPGKWEPQRTEMRQPTAKDIVTDPLPRMYQWCQTHWRHMLAVCRMT